MHTGRIPAWELSFCPFITLLTLSWYLSLLKRLAYQLLYFFFFFLLSHCTAHQSFVSFAFWNPDSVVVSLSALLLHPVYPPSIRALLQCCSHGALCDQGVRPVLVAGFVLCSGTCYFCDVHILKLFIFLAQRQLVDADTFSWS